MAVNYQNDTAYAMTIAKIDITKLTNWIPAEDSVLRHCLVEDIPYGKNPYFRPISFPDEGVTISDGRTRQRDEARKFVQTLQLACISKGVGIDRFDIAGDPDNAANHMNAFGQIVLEGLERHAINGSTKPVCQGWLAAGDGTLNNPAVAAADVTGANWADPALYRGNIMEAASDLENLGFNADTIVMPRLVRPLLAEVMTGTTSQNSEWNVGGMKRVFSRYVHTVATMADFDAYVYDSSRVGIAACSTIIDDWFSEDEKRRCRDAEVWSVPVFNPKHDGTNWKKAIVKIDACSFTPTTDRA